MATRYYKDKVYEYDLTQRNIVNETRLEAIKHVINDMIDGATHSVLRQKLEQDAYGLGKKYNDSNALHIIKEARSVIKQDFKEFVSQAREQIWNASMDLFTESKEVGDRATALKTLQYIGKLSGVEDVQKVDVNLNGTLEIDFGLNED